MDLSNFNERGRVSVVMGGQFGSEAKGLIAAKIAYESPPDFVITNNAPNSGHTVIFPEGPWVGFTLPTAARVCRDTIRHVIIDAGAAIDAEHFVKEVEEAKLDPAKVKIHPRAAIITPADKEYEKNNASGAAKLASTQKGCGRAFARKVMREGAVVADFREFFAKAGIEVKAMDAMWLLEQGMSGMMEIPQGFSLSLNAGLEYPYCTSRDSTVGQGLSDAGIHPKFLGNVMVALRTFPIRVGNLVVNGAEIGNSGSGYPDQKEISFEDIGQPPEYTTVTKRKRRIFTWSDEQFIAMLRHNRPTHLFLNFVNYLRSKEEFNQLLQGMWLASRKAGVPFDSNQVYYGIGPKTSDVYGRFDILSQYGNLGWEGPL